MDQLIAKSIIEIVPQVVRIQRMEMRSHIKENLSIPQFRILMRLSHRINHQAELAEWLGVTAPTMTKFIDGLEEKKLVKRSFAEDDRRKQMIELTPKGKTMIEKQQKETMKLFELRVATLNKDEKKKLFEGLQLLEKAIVNYEKVSF